MSVEISEKEDIARELETLVGRVRAVVAARIVLDAADNVETIHVLATRARTADQIAADIEAVCAAMFNLDIDRSRVRISQPDEPGNDRRRDEVVRLELYSMGIQSGRNSCRITVKLRAGDALYEGVKPGPDVVSMRPRLAALATVEAAEQFYADRRRGEPRMSCTGVVENSSDPAAVATGHRMFVFNELQKLHVGPWQALVASLLINHLDDGDGRRAGETDGGDAYPDDIHREDSAAPDEWLLGCALVRKDSPDAAVRAVLDAVNRYLFYVHADGSAH